MKRLKALTMNIKSIFVCSLLLVAFACHDNNKVVPKNTTLLTLTVDASYLTDTHDDWIMIHAEDGTLLASESFESDQELEITTDKPVSGKIMVTYLRTTKSTGGNKWYTADSYANVETGKHMFFKTPYSPGSSGKFNVSVNNVNFLEWQSVSSRSPTYISSIWNSGTGILGMQSGTVVGMSKYIIAVSDGTALKYKILNNVQPNESYTFSFGDMDPFNHTVDFTFPQSNNADLIVFGGEPDVTSVPNTYELVANYLHHAQSTIKAGYIDILSNYRTVLTVDYPGYAYYYQNLGSVPDGKVAWPQRADFNITEKSFAKFSAAASKSYAWRLSTWGYNDAPSQTYITWNVSASSGNQIIKELPSEFTSLYPDLSLDKIKHSSTTFYTESPTFESVVDGHFNNSPEPTGTMVGIKIITD